MTPRLSGKFQPALVDRIGFEPICCSVCQTDGHPKQPHSPNINERTSPQTLGIPLWSGAAQLPITNTHMLTLRSLLFAMFFVVLTTMVPTMGLEPIRLSALDSESSLSANSSTRAYKTKSVLDQSELLGRRKDLNLCLSWCEWKNVISSYEQITNPQGPVEASADSVHGASP